MGPAVRSVASALGSCGWSRRRHPRAGIGVDGAAGSCGRSSPSAQRVLGASGAAAWHSCPALCGATAATCFPAVAGCAGCFHTAVGTANASGNTLLCKYCRLLRAYPWENFPAEEHRAHGNPLAFIEHLLRAKHGSKEPRPKGKRARDSSCPHQTLIFNVALNFLRRRHIAFRKDPH